MKIAQVAPLYESVPPKLYGGTERVVSYLTEELVAQGHDITLFASGDSRTRARLEAVRPLASRLDKSCTDPAASHILLLERVVQQADRFDVIHFHIDYMHFPLSRRLAVPSVTTLHGRLDLPELQPVYKEFRDRPVISISTAQRNPLPQANWAGTVYHGIPAGLYEPNEDPGTYLAFLGRVSPEKGLDEAIRIAATAGMPLKVAAKVDPADVNYFEKDIKPLLASASVEFVGEIGEEKKSAFLGGALAFLFPIDWPEPFGLAMIEAMACGTPVIAYPKGSVPEIIDEGVTGFIVESGEQAVQAIAKSAQLDRRACRRRFEERFSSQRMSRDYLAIYKTLIQRRAGTPGGRVAAYG